MFYLDVLVGEASYHGGEALTYGSPEPLATGRLVEVPLRNKRVLGVVSGQGKKPPFAVKTVVGVPELPPLPPEQLELLSWLEGYYPAPLGILTQLVLPNQLPTEPLEPKATLKHSPGHLPPLTAEQVAAVRTIEGPGVHLLHGETGSGKTRVYIELAREQLAAGRSVLFLTPEIGLTSQLAGDVRDAFGDLAVVMHSQLTPKVRRERWQHLLTTKEPVVVVGARSALFTPISSLGLIVVDESHETAYKQDQAPYYHATTVAAKLAELHAATLVLGSATPLVTDYYVAKAKGRPIIRMLQTAKTLGAPTESVVVDLKNRDNFSASPHLSTALIAALRGTLERGEQALLFLNRRGTARVVFCEQCGWQSACPHCDLPLVYHGDSHLMRCHTCAHQTRAPGSCPECGSAAIVFKSIGTKAITSEVERLFPEAKVMRFDTDNKKSERLEQHYDALKKGEIDVVVGTQTLAKGLDLPGLSLVGVVAADTSLSFPDFSAQERTYQLLTQVLGRVGRGHRAGEVVVQTYNPDNPILQAALTRDWDTFYSKEIEERRLFRFPPFCFILKLSCKRATSDAAQKNAEAFASLLRRDVAGIAVDGPSPSFHEKVQGKYAWQLVVKTKSRGTLTGIIRKLPSGWSYDIDPMNLL